MGVAKHYTQLIGEADSGNRVELVISASRSLFLRLGLVTWRCGNSRLSIALQTSFIRSLVTDVGHQLLPKVTCITRQINQRRKAPMSSTLSSTRSWFSADPTKSSVDATLVPADPNVPTDPKNEWFSIKSPLLDRRTSRAIVFLITFCIGVAAFLAWQSSREMNRISSADRAYCSISKSRATARSDITRSYDVAAKRGPVSRQPRADEE